MSSASRGIARLSSQQTLPAAERLVGFLGLAIERIQFGAPDQPLVAELNVARAKYAPVLKAS